MTTSKYDELWNVAVLAQKRWHDEQRECITYAKRCREALAGFFGCSQDCVELVPVGDSEDQGRYKVAPFLEFSEKSKCWRFTLRVIVRKPEQNLYSMSFRTDFRLRKTEDGFEIATGEPQPWYKTQAATIDELKEMFDSINNWILDFLSKGYTASLDSDGRVEGFV